MLSHCWPALQNSTRYTMGKAADGYAGFLREGYGITCAYDCIQKKPTCRFRRSLSETCRYNRSDHRFQSASAQGPASPRADGREKCSADPRSCRCGKSRGSSAGPVVPRRSDYCRLYGNWRTTGARAVLPGDIGAGRMPANRSQHK